MGEGAGETKEIKFNTSRDLSYCPYFIGCLPVCRFSSWGVPLLPCPSCRADAAAARAQSWKYMYDDILGSYNCFVGVGNFFRKLIFFFFFATLRSSGLLLETVWCWDLGSSWFLGIKHYIRSSIIAKYKNKCWPYLHPRLYSINHTIRHAYPPH